VVLAAEDEAKAALGGNKEGGAVNAVAGGSRDGIPHMVSMRGGAGNEAARFARGHGGGVGRGHVPVIG
jgi:hypothetical protein